MPGPPPPPPSDVQPIIDKMANYSARNGLLFEMRMRNKNDPRFEFLQDWHVHHPYYLMKKQQVIKVSKGVIHEPLFLENTASFFCLETSALIFVGRVFTMQGEVIFNYVKVQVNCA